MSNKTFCQKIADLFAPQTKPQPRFYVPVKETEEIFDWLPVLEKAKLDISKEAKENLASFNKNFKEEVENFKIEITIYRNNTIKFVREGKIDIVPIDEIRKVSLVKGRPPRVVNWPFFVLKDGSFFEDRFFDCHTEGKSVVYADFAQNYNPDTVKIFPALEIECPCGTGISIVEKIQELMAEAK